MTHVADNVHVQVYWCIIWCSAIACVENGSDVQKTLNENFLSITGKGVSCPVGHERLGGTGESPLMYVR